MAWSMIMLTVSESVCVCVYTVYECVCVCVCAVPLYSVPDRMDGNRGTLLVIAGWLSPFSPLPWMQKIKPQMVVSAVWWRSRMWTAGWASGLWVCVCVYVCVVCLFFFFLTCFHPGFGICQLRTNGGIFVGVKTGRVPRQHRYQQQGWLSFRGHKQDSVCAHNNVEQVLRRPSSQQHPVISRKWNLHPCPLVFGFFLWIPAHNEKLLTRQ